MALHSGIDTVAVASRGVYTKTYGSTDQSTINILYASFGFAEEAPEPAAISCSDVYDLVILLAADVSKIMKKLNFIIANQT